MRPLALFATSFVWALMPLCAQASLPSAELIAASDGTTSVRQLPPAPELIDVWHPPASPPVGGVVDPVDLAIAVDGTAFVVDRRLSRVQRFNADGQVLTEYRCNAAKSMCLDSPLAVVLDEARNRLFVADTGNSRLVIFSMDGEWRDVWTGFRQPEALTMGLDGRVYAYDRGLNGIRAKRPDGRDDVLIPVTLATATFANLPHGLATNAKGNILFASEAPVRDAAPVIYEFTPEGETVPHRQQISWNPRDIAVDRAGMVFILDGEGGRLVRNFNLDRPGGGAIGTAAIGGRVLAIAASGADDVYLLESSTNADPPALRRVSFDGRNLKEVARHEFPPLALGWFAEPLRVAAGPTGEVAVVDGFERAQTFHRGRALSQLRRTGLYDAAPVADGGFVVLRLRTPSRLDAADDPDRAPDGKRVLMVERYDMHANGTAELRWDLRRTESITASSQSNFAALAVDSERGWVYVLESNRQQVLVLKLANGDRLGAWILPDLDGLIGYTDIAIAEDGTVNLLNAGMNTLVRYKAEDGHGNIPASPPSIGLPRGSIRFDMVSDDDLILTSGSEMLWRITADGSPRYMWSFDAPDASGEPPTDIAIGARDEVYLVDRAASLVAVYSTRGPEAVPPTVWLPMLWRQ